MYQALHAVATALVPLLLSINRSYPSEPGSRYWTGNMLMGTASSEACELKHEQVVGEHRDRILFQEAAENEDKRTSEKGAINWNLWWGRLSLIRKQL